MSYGSKSESASTVPSAGAPARNSLLAGYFEASLYLLLLTAVLTLASTGRLDAFTTIAAPFALLWKGWRRWCGRGAELSHRLATICVLAYFAFAPVDYLTFSHAHAEGAPNPSLYAALLAAIHLLLFVTLVRLYSATTRRDHLFLAILAFAAMLASAVLTVGAAFLGFFVVFVLLGISTLLSLELLRASDGAVTPPLDPASPGARRVARALSLTSVEIAVGAIVLGAIIFFVLPRFTGGYLSGYSVRPSLMTGFNENVELGQIGEIQKSSAVVMRVKIEGEPGRFSSVRWRGIALTTFDGWRWSNHAGSRQVIVPGGDGWLPLSTTAVYDGRLQRSTKSPSGRTLHYEILLEPVASDAVFVAADATAVRGRFASGSGLADTIHRNYLLMDSTRSIFNPFPKYTELSYEATSVAPPRREDQLRAVGTNYPADVRDRYLQLPALDSRIPPLAVQATAGAANPYDKAVALEKYLRTHYGYTLELTALPVNDPLATFLFVRRAGHCEYFASAMTVMLRSLGIPARYINGFQTGEYNDVGGDFIVRASDAHSWVEAYFPGAGWVEFDPTPASDAGKPLWFAAFAKYWDWFQLQWGDWVVNYDFLHQIAMAQGVQHTSHEWIANARQRFDRMYDAMNNAMLARMRASQTGGSRSAPLKLPALIAAAFAVLLLLLRGEPLLAWLAAFWNLRIRGAGMMTPKLASLQYEEMLRLLERRGWRKATGTTAFEFAASIRQPELALPVGRLTEIYQATRFGGSEANLQSSAALLNEIRERLKAQRRAR
jgi:protein-glutamine gamma-glutamyltransferase